MTSILSEHTFTHFPYCMKSARLAISSPQALISAISLSLVSPSYLLLKPDTCFQQNSISHHTWHPQAAKTATSHDGSALPAKLTLPTAYLIQVQLPRLEECTFGSCSGTSFLLPPALFLQACWKLTLFSVLTHSLQPHSVCRLSYWHTAPCMHSGGCRTDIQDLHHLPFDLGVTLPGLKLLLTCGSPIIAHHPITCHLITQSMLHHCTVIPSSRNLKTVFLINVHSLSTFSLCILFAH